MPITAFIGVRISWLIVARKALLASFAASAAARDSCVSLNRRAFWIAIAACSAKVWSSRCSLSVKKRGGSPMTMMAPMPRPCHSIGAVSCEKLLPIRSASRRAPGGTPSPCMTSGMWKTPPRRNASSTELPASGRG